MTAEVENNSSDPSGEITSEAEEEATRMAAAIAVATGDNEDPAEPAETKEAKDKPHSSGQHRLYPSPAAALGCDIEKQQLMLSPIPTETPTINTQTVGKYIFEKSEEKTAFAAAAAAGTMAKEKSHDVNYYTDEEEETWTSVAFDPAAEIAISAVADGTMAREKAKKQCENYDEEMAMPTPPPVTSGLDRQRAGYVQPKPGAIAITHPSYHQDSGRSSIGTITTSESDSFAVATATNTTQSQRKSSQSEVSSTTNTTTITAGSSTTNNSYSSSPSHPHQRNPYGDLLIEAELVESRRNPDNNLNLIEAELVTTRSPIAMTDALEVVNIKKERRKHIIWVLLGFIIVAILVAVPLSLKMRRLVKAPDNYIAPKYPFHC